MTQREWIGVMKRIKANWPHAEIPPESLAKWYDDLAQISVAAVTAAVESIYRDGREFPPNGGQILARAVDLGRGDPDHGEAWSLAMRAVREFGVYQGEDALAWLAEHSQAVAIAVERFGFHDLCMFSLDDQATVRAQFREVYRGVVGERQRDDVYAGLPGAAPKRLGRGPRPIAEAIRRALPKGAES